MSRGELWVLCDSCGTVIQTLLIENISQKVVISPIIIIIIIYKK